MLIFNGFLQIFKYCLKYLKLPLNLVISIIFFLLSPLVWAGSYEDFFKAVQLDQATTVQRLLQRGFDPNTVGPDGVPALIKALHEQSFKVARVLAEHPQTRSDIRNTRDESPLMLAALRGQEALVIQLVSRGAAVNQSGWSALHYAATGGHARIAAFLIGAKADVNAESPNGTTPLMMAAMYGNEETVKLLLESGAEAYPRNDNGLSAEDFALRAGREGSVQLIRQVLAR